MIIHVQIIQDNVYDLYKFHLAQTQACIKHCLQSNGDKTLRWVKPIHAIAISSTVTVDGVWDSWSIWSDCDVTCNSGTRTRNRTCTGVQYGGSDCIGEDTESDTCNDTPCPSEYSSIFCYIIYKSFFRYIVVIVSSYNSNGDFKIFP